MLLLYILWDDEPIFMISGANEQLQQQLEYTLHPDCHSWWISKMQSGREDTLEERYAMKVVLNLEKMLQKRMECFRLLLKHLAWIEHQFFSGIRDSRKAGSLWGVIGGVGGVRKSIDQSWLAKGLGLGLLCWGFKGVQEEIPSEVASTLSDYINVFQIRWEYKVFHNCRNIAVASHIQEGFHGAFQKLLERYKCIAAGGEYFEGDYSFMCVLSIKVAIRKSLETYCIHFVFLFSFCFQTIAGK